MDKALRTLAVSGFSPAAYEARQRFWALGLAEDGGSAPPASSPSGIGDVFFASDGDIFFLLAQGPQFQEQDRLFLSFTSTSEVALRIGLITKNPENAPKRLQGFAMKVESAVANSIGGKKPRTVRFDWQEPSEEHPIAQRLQESDETNSTVTFKSAELNESEVQGSETLADPEIRGILIQLSRARIAQADDLWKGRPRGHRRRIEAALDKLETAKLVEVNQLIRCKKANDPLMQLHDTDELKTVKEFLHPACGEKYGDHELVPAYSISQLGQTLAQASHWMTVWVTKRLVDLGIPEDQIVWTVASGSEEIDIAVSFLGELWIFELKDREFGVGDALPFNYRHRVRYQANEAVVITTEKVSRDARRVLDQMAEGTKRSASAQWAGMSDAPDNSKPILIEGLQAVGQALKKSFDNAATRAAGDRVRDLERVTGLPVAAAVQARLG